MRCKICDTVIQIVPYSQIHCTVCLEHLDHLKLLLESTEGRHAVRAALIAAEQQAEVDTEEALQQEYMTFSLEELEAMLAVEKARLPSFEGDGGEKLYRLTDVIDRKKGKPVKLVYGQLPRDIAGMY